MDIPLEAVSARASWSHPNLSLTSVHSNDSPSNRVSQRTPTPASNSQLSRVSSTVSTLQIVSAAQEESTVDSNGVPTPNETSDLAPADRGIQAWMYLVGAFVVETLLWGTLFHLICSVVPDVLLIGFPNSFGVFLTYYSDAFGGEAGAELLLPLAGTLCSGIVFTLLCVNDGLRLKSHSTRSNVLLW